MRLYSKIVLLSLVIILTTGLLVIHGQKRHQQAESVDVNNFPIVDQANPKPRIGADKEKSKKYNSHDRSSATLEQVDKVFVGSDWDSNLPAFPTARSTVIALGKIKSADAYLSEDLTTVYSEFEFEIEKVLKNQTKTSFKVKDEISVERLGGRVRFPSGKITVVTVSHQDMPRIGNRYILFLTNDFIEGGKYEDLFILTGYELKEGRVFPLDKVSPGHPIAKYTGVDEETFMKDLASTLTN